MDEVLSSDQFTMDHLLGFAISAAIGFLIGLERQFSKEVKEDEEQFAGVRTLTMICIFGYVAALLSSKLGPWIFVIAMASLFLLVIVSYYLIASKTTNKGGTSEIATIITFLLGAVVFAKLILFALAITVVVLLLLAYKPPLHAFVKNMTRQELLAIISFVIISALVIPFLPDNNFGPYDLWNLPEIWKMVILVCGTSLVGYLVAKILGNKGTLVGGIVGGLVSSTSVALTYSRRSKESSGAGSAFYFGMGILGACTIMFPRILFEVFVVNPELAKKLWIPILLITAAGLGMAWIVYRFKKGKSDSGDIELKNPLDFKTAVQFALLFAGVQWLVKFSSERFGEDGTYVAGAISGITDVDAITLSMAKLAGDESQHSLAINTILIAALSNTLVKFIIVLVVGSAELRKVSLLGFSSLFGMGVLYFLYRIFI